MIRSDFKWVNFDEKFTDANPQATRNFFIDGNPVDTGYLLIQIKDIDIHQNDSISQHRILINGNNLPSFDLPMQEGNQRWTTWMDRIPKDFLQLGLNRIKIVREGSSDNFSVANVAIHWREKDDKCIQPHALGIVGSHGLLLQNIGIDSATRLGEGEYEIILENKVLTRPIVLITPTIVSFADRIPTYTFDQGADNRIIVRFVDLSKNPIDATV